MIQKLNGRRRSAALAPHRENTTLDADGPETWGSWYNRRLVLFPIPFAFPIANSRFLGSTPWWLSNNPFEPECAVLAIKYANLLLTSALPHL
jgi:hypothetical protein